MMSFVAGGILATKFKSKIPVLGKVKQFTKSSLTNFQILGKYKEVVCPKNSISIAIFGQSNSANSVSGKFENPIPGNLYQYDWKSQKCYRYQEPLLGSTGRGGNAITYTSVRLANQIAKPIIIIPFGVGGRSVLHWAYKDLSHQHDIVMTNMKENDLSPDIFLWHQGERDAKNSKYSTSNLIKTEYFLPNKKDRMGLGEDEYYDALKSIIDKTFKSFPNSRFGVALATICGTHTPQWEPVRNAQLRITQDVPGIFISADSDMITGEDNRADGCHFSPKGASQLGDMYYLSIYKQLGLVDNEEVTQ